MNKITRKGYNKCLNDIISVKQKITEVIKRIHDARKNGDFSENAELHSELKTKKHLDMKLSKLMEITGSWDVIDITDILDITIIQIGATVQLLKVTSIFIYQIVGEYESDITQNKISYKTPFAQILIGKKGNDTFEYQGNIYIIKSINYNDIA